MVTRDDLECIHCGALKEEHHEYEAPAIPDGCVCDPREWGDPTEIPAVCEAFVPMGSLDTPEADDICKTCEHEQPCHRKHAHDLHL